MKHIKKHSGKIVDFDRVKLKNSIYKTFISNHYPSKEANHFTDMVIADVESWLDKKTVVTTNDIRSMVNKELEKIDHAIALSYKKHKHLW
ncbi:MAG: ATP cone domain-containing protein [Patescibacteria group bacterium]|jgi:transcriptional regulator NrdR family protein|nr:ATP cone domain-containing protein [Patescibacteria group bacterium]